MGDEISVPLLLLTAYIWVIILGGLTGLVIDLRKDAKSDCMLLQSWNLSWIDFGLGTWIFVVATILAAPSFAYYALELLDVPVDDLALSSLISGAAFHGIALLLIVLALKRRSTANMKLSPNRLRLPEILKTTALYYFSGIFLTLVFSKIWEVILTYLESLGLAPAVQPQDLVTIFAEGGFGLVSIGLMVLAVVIAPITEELIFRAGIYRFFKGRFSARFALITSSLLFAMMHMNTMSFLPLFLLGMLLCRSYERSGNILVPIGFHALFNANNIFLLLFQAEVEPMLEDMATGMLLMSNIW
ncbi:CPBP family intramembrane glutamic endopeptidase [Rubellicoccus peritrichatus]|uniref:CPBP family intramembrane glutamic endopeptidase n=1 Tax=Rubellicoccus peritrichatus TaxID=3080537 RepID=A0AAQ3LDH0_9BACT|nr:CPBP family intramembrane glutamic endopeptidase [Puniceicoccus sp. CR14]WOO43466.1 CPBP family intramembrane glutamic endopeptidase [Puniceicoccus sp. CR14]